MEEMVPLATDPVESKLKSVVSTPITVWLKVTVKEAELVTAPLPVVMDRRFGNAGEKGTAGTIRSSNLKSSSRGKPEALRAFLFCALLKILRKAFKSMEGISIYKILHKKQIAELYASGQGKNLNLGGSNRRWCD